MGGDLQMPDGSGRTAVECAREKGQMELVKVLTRKSLVRGR